MFDKFNDKYKQRKIKKRYLNLDYDIFPIMNISMYNVTSLMENENSENLLFKSHLYKNKYLPIYTNTTTRIFSENSLNFLFLIEKNNTLLIIDDEKNNLSYEIRFDIPKDKNATNEIKDTTCVQYNFNIPYISCESWYDYNNNQVVCVCKNSGLTSNLFDKILSSANKMMQFQLLDGDMCKYYFKNLFN